MIPQQDSRKWRRGVENAILALALRDKRDASAIGLPVPVADALPLSRKSYVAPVDGNDNTGTGSTSKPFKTLTAAVERMGKATSAADFETPWRIEAQQPGRLDDAGPFVKVPTRRIALHMPGVLLPAAIGFEVRDGDRYGSPRFAELALSGGSPGRFGGGLGDLPTEAFRIRNNVGNALMVDAEKGGVVIRMDGVLCSGHVLYRFADATTAGMTLEASRTVFSGVTLAPGLGVIGGGPVDAKCFAWLRECVIAPRFDLELRSLLEMAACYVGAGVTVQAVPADVVIGITDSMWLHGSSFTGPPASMLVDHVTDHWLTANGISISTDAKRVLE